MSKFGPLLIVGDYMSIYALYKYIIHPDPVSLFFN